ncbi:hypothetical protein ALO63_05389, partial [Pseudomonas amygdali pv. mori]
MDTGCVRLPTIDRARIMPSVEMTSGTVWAQPYRRGRHRVMDNNHTFSSWLRSPAHHQWLTP